MTNGKNKTKQQIKRNSGNNTKDIKEQDQQKHKTKQMNERSSENKTKDIN